MKIKLKNFALYRKKEHLSFFLSVLVFSCVSTSYGLKPIMAVELNTTTHALQQQISGVITDANGQPIPGVNVIEKGTTNGAQTDFDGVYTLSVSTPNAVLVASFVGFKTKEIALSNETTLNITLEEDISQLDEVVVVGFGSQNSSKVATSVAQVTSEELGTETRPVTNLSSALVGALPGLNSSNSAGGAPGTNQSFSIRGASSLNPTAALVIIDNFEGTLEDINPQEIETATILKDAAAVAIYGARGANGVLLITTKKTKKSENISVTYNLSQSIQSSPKFADLMTAEEYVKFSNVADSGAFSDEVVALAESGFYPDTQWADELYRSSAAQQSHNLTIKGGSENIGVLMNTGYLDQDGLAIGEDNFKRLNLRLKIDADITDWLEVGTNALITNRVINATDITSGTNLIGSPFYPVTSVDGYYVNNDSGSINPIAAAQAGSYNRVSRDNLNIQAYAKIKPLKGLSLEQSISVLKNHTNQRLFNNTFEYINLDFQDADSYTNIASPNRSINPAESDARTFTLASTTSYTVTALTRLNYDFNINNTHNFKVLLGFQSKEYEGEGFGASRKGFALDTPVDLILGEENNTVSGEELGNYSYIENSATLSYFGRLNYDYKNRYIIEGSFRYDGSSYFAENNKYGFFPSVALAWNVKAESFMYNANWVDKLKVRTSYGITGDDNGVEGLTTQLVSYSAAGGYPIGSTTNSGYALGAYANPNLKWETAKILNFGLDVSLFKGKLQVNGDYFINNREDIIDTDSNTADEFGFGDVTANLYDVKSWGWELDLKHENNIGENFSYWVGGNLSYYDNEITDLAGFDSELVAVGQSISDRHGYVTDGYFSSEAEIASHADQTSVGGAYVGGFKYTDQLTIDSDGDGVFDTGDGVINIDDRVIIDNNTATNYRVGFNLGFNYKDLSVSARFYGAFDRNQYFNNALSHEPLLAPNSYAYHLDYWSPDNTDALLPVPVGSGNQNYTSTVSDFIKNNEFIKLQNITIGYNLKKALNIKQLKSVNINLSMENLGVIWTNSPVYKYGWDPEVVTGNFSYPLPLTTSLGLNITL